MTFQFANIDLDATHTLDAQQWALVVTTPAGVIKFRSYDDKDICAEAELTIRGEKYEVKGQTHPHGFFLSGAQRPSFLDKRKVTEPQLRKLRELLLDAHEFAKQNGYLERFKAFRAKLAQGAERARLISERSEILARLAEIDAALAV